MPDKSLSVVELFAGVGGFRLGLEGHPDPKWNCPGSGFKVVWANQWEPPGSDKRQFAFDCYVKRFDPDHKHPERHSNEDIAQVLDEVEAGSRVLPAHDVLVGGFPCQDYSVAKPLSMAEGIHGNKGVLWWEIYRLLKLMGDDRPRYLVLENVDRLLKSPAAQRGRDFAIILSCLSSLGYSVEWRVINAADYGFPQRRRRVFIYGEHTHNAWDLRNRILSGGVLAEAFPVESHPTKAGEFDLVGDAYDISQDFGVGDKVSKFMVAGAMQAGRVVTMDVRPSFDATTCGLGEILVPESDVPAEYFLTEESIPKWRYYKGGKKEPRTDRNGFEYMYSEGGMAFPDPLDRPSRTILTGEGGVSASRFKHVVTTPSGRLRRLVPEELEALNGFPSGWTNTGMTAGNRAFCMGNALVVGVVQRIGNVIISRASQSPTDLPHTAR